MADNYTKWYNEQKKEGKNGAYENIERMYRQARKYKQNEEKIPQEDIDNYNKLEQDYSNFFVNGARDIDRKIDSGEYQEGGDNHIKAKRDHLLGTLGHLYKMEKVSGEMNWLRKNDKAKEDIKFFEGKFTDLIEKKNKEITEKEKEYTYATGGDKKNGLSDAENLELTEDRLAVANAQGEHLNSRLENMTYSSKEEKAKDEEAQQKNIKEIQRLTAERRRLKERLGNNAGSKTGESVAEPEKGVDVATEPETISTNGGMGHSGNGDDCCCCRELKQIREILEKSPLGDDDKNTINDKLTKVETSVREHREVYASRNSSVPEAVVNGPATASFSPQPKVVNGTEVEQLTSEFAAGGSGDRINSNKLYRNDNDVIMNKPYTDMSPQITRHAIYRPDQDYKYIVEKFGRRACDTSSPFSGPGSFTVNSGLFGNASDTSRLDEQHYALARSGFRGVGSRLGRGFTTGPAARLGGDDLFAELNEPLDMQLPEFHNERIADFQNKVTGTVMAPAVNEKLESTCNAMHQTVKQMKDILNNRLPGESF